MKFRRIYAGMNESSGTPCRLYHTPVLVLYTKLTVKIYLTNMQFTIHVTYTVKVSEISSTPDSRYHYVGSSIPLCTCN